MQQSNNSPVVLYEDRQVLVISKPAGMLSQKDRTGDPSAVEWAREYLAPRQGSANPFVAPVHRLDRPVSGALVLARTSKSAARLTAQFRETDVRKEYLAVVCGSPRFEARKLTLWLRKDRRRNRVECSESKALPGAAEATTGLQVVVRGSDFSLVTLRPNTGRPHQLRATLAHLGSPIAGDLKYGAPTGLGHWLALHSRSVTFRHPIGGETLQFVAPLPEVWTETFPWLENFLNFQP